jgi:hypothetical protein
MHAKKTTGVFAFNGRGNALDQIRITSYEAWYRLGNDTVWFRNVGKLSFRPGEPVTVLYQPQHPTDARVYSMMGFWGSTAVYESILLLVLLAVFVHPDIVPWHAKLRLQYKKPFIQVI